jgi:hypothetical protein
MEHPGIIPPSPDLEPRSWKEIVADVIRDIENIFRTELRLAATELKTKLQKAAIPVAMLAGAGLLAFFAGACFLTACIVALALVLPLWLSCLIMGVLLAAGAGGAFVVGRMALQEIDPLPQRTLETMKDNVEFAKTRAGA